MKYNNNDGLLNDISVEILHGKYVHISIGNPHYRIAQNRIDKLMDMCWKGGVWNQKLYEKMMSKSDYKKAMKLIERVDEYLSQLKIEHNA